jgi:hypothetical protein
MERRPLVRVVILYLHPLLGEGLAKLVAAEPGIDVTAIREDDAMGAAVALAGRPDVVVEERGGRAWSATRLEPGFAPVRLFIGIDGTGFGGDDESMTVDPELIVRAVRTLRQRRLEPVGA